MATKRPAHAHRELIQPLRSRRRHRPRIVDSGCRSVSYRALTAPNLTGDRIDSGQTPRRRGLLILLVKPHKRKRENRYCAPDRRTITRKVRYPWESLSGDYGWCVRRRGAFAL